LAGRAGFLRLARTLWRKTTRLPATVVTLVTCAPSPEMSRGVNSDLDPGRPIRIRPDPVTTWTFCPIVENDKIPSRSSPALPRLFVTRHVGWYP
jgi:hypothetical protein